jgi:hypothetical protein
MGDRATEPLPLSPELPATSARNDLTVAGLEALHGLHALAGERVGLTLIAPEDEFVYRPIAVEKPFVAGTLDSVDTENKVNCERERVVLEPVPLRRRGERDDVEQHGS